MPTLAELPHAHIELDPDAPRPPFPLWMQMPGAWSLLDTHPSTWKRSAQQLIDTTWHGSGLPAAEKRTVLKVLEDLVADCQRAGAALNLVILGQLEPGTAFSAGIHLAFAGDRRPASLGRVHDMLGSGGTTVEIDTASGPAVLHRSRSTMVVPGTAKIVAMTTAQVFLPFPGTNWTAVLSTSSAFPALTEPLVALLRRIAASIRLTPEQQQDAATPTPDEQDWTPLDGARMPGLAKGFGTMVARSIGERPEAGPGTSPETSPEQGTE
jgi:hypothetical protein